LFESGGKLGQLRPYLGWELFGEHSRVHATCLVGPYLSRGYEAPYVEEVGSLHKINSTVCTIVGPGRGGNVDSRLIHPAPLLLSCSQSR